MLQVLRGRKADDLIIVAVKGGIIAKAAGLERGRNAACGVKAALCVDNAFLDGIIPNACSDDHFKAAVQIGFIAVQMLGKLVERPFGGKVRIDKPDDLPYKTVLGGAVYRDAVRIISGKAVKQGRKVGLQR